MYTFSRHSNLNELVRPLDCVFVSDGTDSPPLFLILRPHQHLENPSFRLITCMDHILFEHPGRKDSDLRLDCLRKYFDHAIHDEIYCRIPLSSMHNSAIERKAIETIEFSHILPSILSGILDDGRDPQWQLALLQDILSAGRKMMYFPQGDMDRHCDVLDAYMAFIDPRFKSRKHHLPPHPWTIGKSAL